MISVKSPRTVNLKEACAGITKSVDMRDVFATKITFQFKEINAHHVSKYHDFINVAVAIVLVLYALLFFDTITKWPDYTMMQRQTHIHVPYLGSSTLCSLS